MTAWGALAAASAWQPTVLLGCAALLALYLAAARPLRARAACFTAGVVVLLLALVSPLDTLGDRYLFSAHMLQHLLLLLVVPPLLLLGIPPWLCERLLRRAPAAHAERVLGHPMAAWLIGAGTLWVWHVPTLYDAALAHEGLHVLQHLCFLVSATIFWWPVLAPVPDRRLGALSGGAYLITGSMANSLLGVVITFAPPGLYPAYAHPVDTLGLLPLLRQDWGLSYAGDQQLGGLLMWVGSIPVFIAACLGVMIRWYHEPEPDLVDGGWSRDLDPHLVDDPWYRANAADDEPGLAAAPAPAARVRAH